MQRALPQRTSRMRTHARNRIETAFRMAQRERPAFNAHLTNRTFRQRRRIQQLHLPHDFRTTMEAGRIK